MADYLQNLIKSGLLNSQGQAWDMNRFDASNPYMGGKDGRSQRYYGTPLTQEQATGAVDKLNAYNTANNSWRSTLDNWGKQNGQITTTEQENYLKSLPEYKSAWQAANDAESYLRPLVSGAVGKNGADKTYSDLWGENKGVLEPTKPREGFNIGRTVAGIVGNPITLPLAFLTAGAGSALLGAAGAGSGAASTALPWATGASTGATAGAAGAGSGGWFSSLLKGVGSIPTMASEAVGGGTLGGIASGAIKGATIGGLSSGLTGNNIGKGILSGALTGGATGGIGASLEGTELGDFLGIEPSVTGADSDFLSKAQAGSGLPWSASAEPSTLSQLGKTLGLGGGGSSSMSTLGMLAGGANDYFANKKALKQLNNAGNDAMNLLNPYIQQGSASTSRLADLLGLSGNAGAEGYGSLAKSFSPSDLQNDPGYQFQLAEGQKALDRNSAARGGYYSGAALKDAAKYTQGLADTTYKDAFNRDLQQRSTLYSLLSGQQGVGANAAGSGADIATSLGSLRAGAGLKSTQDFNSLLSRYLFG